MKTVDQLFFEFDKHLLEDNQPSVYFNDMLKSSIFYETYPFTLLGKLKDTEQGLTHHPEGNVWNHTMLVVDECAKRKGESENSRVFMWAGLLHDLGKAPTTKVRNGKITSYDHDKVGVKLCNDFLSGLTHDSDFINYVSKLVRWHMHILFIVKDLPFADMASMLDEVSIEELALFSLCDRLGRGNMTRDKVIEEEKNIEIFIKKCKSYLAKKAKS